MKPLNYLITSRVKVKLITYFACNKKPIGIRDLAELIQEDPGNVARFMHQASRAGLLQTVPTKRFNKYQPTDSPAWGHLRGLTDTEGV